MLSLSYLLTWHLELHPRGFKVQLRTNMMQKKRLKLDLKTCIYRCYHKYIIIDPKWETHMRRWVTNIAKDNLPMQQMDENHMSMSQCHRQVILGCITLSASSCKFLLGSEVSLLYKYLCFMWYTYWSSFTKIYI